MPHYCVDACPVEYGDRTVHDLTPAKCPRLPREEHQETLGWCADLHSALARARLRYKTATRCRYCCED